MIIERIWIKHTHLNDGMAQLQSAWEEGKEMAEGILKEMAGRDIIDVQEYH